jgi:hypothetical protein
MKEAGYIVQASLRHTWDKANGFGVHVVNCRQNMAIADETFYGSTFPELATMVFGEESDGSWE